MHKKRKTEYDLQALPRQGTTIEVHQDVTERLHVVSSTLLNAEMGVDACVPRRARQILVFAVSDVLPGPVITIFLCQAVVDKKNL